MKSWLSWLKGNSYSASKNPVAIFGRFILSLWVAIIALTGIVMGVIFLSDPSGFSPPKPKPDCITVEINGEARDSCEYLYP
jgi:hypothetical protein